MIAVTQARGVGPGKAYLDKVMSSGKTRVESLRLLRRRLSDAAFTALRAYQLPQSEHGVHTANPAQDQAA